MTTIYLIRHAEAEGNLYRFAQGQFEGCITRRGYSQIDCLAERFRDIHIDRLYSSDLKRTQVTAGAILRYHKLPLELKRELREICLGVCEGMSFGNMKELDPEQMYNFNNDPMAWHCEGAESFAECTERLLGAVTKIAEENDGRVVAVVSHGMAIRSLLAQILKVESRDIHSLPHGDNTAVSLLKYEDGKFEVEYYNDNSHISEELSTFAGQTWWRAGTGGSDADNLSYRAFDPRESGEKYLEFYRSAWLSAHGNLDFFTPDWFLQTAIRRVEREPRSFVGVYREGALIGLLEMDLERGKNRGFGWISLLCLDEVHRGHGLGVQPLGYAVLFFKKLGMKSLRLHVSTENKSALSFYTRWGFETLKTEAGAGAPVCLMEMKFDC